ncbi:MAG: hypothetical protein AAGH89_08245, partial [Verrucomicrobiota bacterium]
VRYVEFAQKKVTEFQALDRDRSKTLTAAEFEKSEPIAEWDLFALPEFAKMDTDGDANVAFKEYGSAVKKVFDTLDAIESGSPDGQVAKGEYLAAVSQKKAEASAAAAAMAAQKGSAAQKKGSTTQPKK